MQPSQSAKNHTAVTPLQHYIWLPLGFILLVSSLIYVVATLIKGTFTISSLILLGTTILAIISGMLARKYALTLQDRIIRTEETLRYFMLTNQQIDKSITSDQLIGLRFASDEEFVSLVEKTVKEKLTKEEIKEEIKNWRADHHRV